MSTTSEHSDYDTDTSEHSDYDSNKSVMPTGDPSHLESNDMSDEDDRDYGTESKEPDFWS